jgi:hypothetical protein
MAVRTSYRPREQMRAAAILGGLVLGVLALWIVVMATTGSQTARPDPFADADLEAAPPGEDPDASDGTAAQDESQDSETGDDGADQPREDGAASDDGEGDQDQADQSEDDADSGTADDADDEEEADRADDDDPARAIDLEAARTTWVAIVSSLSGDEFTEAAARDRLDAGQVLLWSSDYPSLNPGLWVIVEGPFDTEDEARRAARRVGNGAYPRVLTDDADDRYCALANGCGGEAGA